MWKLVNTSLYDNILECDVQDKTAAALLVNDNGVTLAKQSTATLSLAAQDEPLQLMGLDEVCVRSSAKECRRADRHVFDLPVLADVLLAIHHSSIPFLPLSRFILLPV